MQDILAFSSDNYFFFLLTLYPRNTFLFNTRHEQLSFTCSLCRKLWCQSYHYSSWTMIRLRCHWAVKRGKHYQKTWWVDLRLTQTPDHEAILAICSLFDRVVPLKAMHFIQLSDNTLWSNSRPLSPVVSKEIKMVIR